MTWLGGSRLPPGHSEGSSIGTGSDPWSSQHGQRLDTQRLRIEAWSSARVGGDQTGPTRAPNRRLPAARVDNPLRAPISAVLTGASAVSDNVRLAVAPSTRS